MAISARVSGIHRDLFEKRQLSYRAFVTSIGTALGYRSSNHAEEILIRREEDQLPHPVHTNGRTGTIQSDDSGGRELENLITQTELTSF